MGRTDQHPLEGVVARILRGHKRSRRDACEDAHAQPAMRECLIVVGDGLGRDCDPEPLGGVELRQLPQTAEQSVGAATCEEQLAVAFRPYERAIEDR